MIDTIMAWCGFAGAWLLVAGALYQGALELKEQNLDRTGFDTTVESIEPPPRPSPWWWFLPPAMFVLRRRRANEYHRDVLSQFTPQQRAERSVFIQKATGWFVVASGASLLAVKETWELVELAEWPAWVFVAALILMTGLVTGATVRLIGRRQEPAD